MRSTDHSGAGTAGFGFGESKHSGLIEDKRAGRLSSLVRHGPAELCLAALIVVVALAFALWDGLNSFGALTTHLPQDQMETAIMFAQIALRSAGALALGFTLAGIILRRQIVGPHSDGELQRYRDLIATIPFGVACWTAHGQLIICNEQYLARLRLDQRDLRPGASYHASIARLTQGGYTRLITDDDANRVFELHREDGSCLLSDERPLSTGGFVTLVTDVTEQLRTDHLLSSIREEQRVLARRYHEEKLRAEAASYSKTSFLAHLSHDIRTPLNHIIGFAEMMQHETYGPLGDPRYSNYVDTIKGSGERLLSFFASILELSEFENGEVVLRPEPVPADDVLAAAANRYASQAMRAGLTLAVGRSCGAELVCDRLSLERMVGNLIDNAIRFTPKGGRVTLAAYAAADGAVLEITDTGIGISEERLSTLSQPFAFGDAALTRERGGAGLGLTIARAIAELNGGRLAIDSSLGFGTTVAVSLPLAANEAHGLAA